MYYENKLGKVYFEVYGQEDSPSVLPDFRS